MLIAGLMTAKMNMVGAIHSGAGAFEGPLDKICSTTLKRSLRRSKDKAEDVLLDAIMVRFNIGSI